MFSVNTLYDSHLNTSFQMSSRYFLLSDHWGLELTRPASKIKLRTISYGWDKIFVSSVLTFKIVFL